MKKRVSWSAALAVVLSLFLLQGCASSNKSFARQSFSSLGPVKVCRYETPSIMKSTGTETAFLALVTLAAPGGSALLVMGDEYAKVRGFDTQRKIPDFGFLVMSKFLTRIKNERPDWPDLTVIQDPLKEDFSEKCTVIEFKVNRVAYGSLDLTRGGIVLERGLDKGMISNGFLSKATVSLKDLQGEVLWQKSYIYLSDNFDRGMSVDELEANDFALLKEEMDFAAEKTVEDFIAHLNSEAKKREEKQNSVEKAE